MLGLRVPAAAAAAARRLASSPRAMAAAAAAMAVPAAVWMAHARSAASAPSAELERLANTPPAGALAPTEFRGFKLLSVKPLTGDTARYTFALPRENDELGLVTASCLVVKGEVDGAWRGEARARRRGARRLSAAGARRAPVAPAAARRRGCHARVRAALRAHIGTLRSRAARAPRPHPRVRAACRQARRAALHAHVPRAPAWHVRLDC
jgi:hypothetical protein